MAEDGGAFGAQLRTKFEVGGTLKMAGAHEVVNHLHVPADFEQPDRVVLQTLRHRGHHVTRVDRMGDDGLERGVLAQQGDVCAVKGGHHRHCQSSVGQNALGVHRRTGMGNGVVHVEQVEVVGLDHLHHFARQHQFVRRVLKQRVLRHLHFVVVHSRVEGAQTHRLVVRDEMHLVPLCGQGLAQFGGHHAASPKRGVAHDAYTQTSCGGITHRCSQNDSPPPDVQG